MALDKGTSMVLSERMARAASFASTFGAQANLTILPLSLFGNDGAHAGFRRFQAGDVPFAPLRVYDLTGAGVFPGVATRYGAAVFRRGEGSAGPIRCDRFDGGRWRTGWLRPVGGARPC